MLDRFGREIDYLRVSLTDKCNLRCIYCRSEKDCKESNESLMTFNEVLEAVNAVSTLGIKKIRYTGGEPLLFERIDELIYKTSKIDGIDDISITTNGILLYDMVDSLKSAGLKRINISLDTLKQDRYSKITRGGSIEKVFSAIYRCIQIGLNPIKLNVVLIDKINDDEVLDFINLTTKLPVHIRFIELMPIGEGKKFYQNGMISSNEIINNNPGLIPVSGTKGSTARIYKLKGAKGTIGFISPLSCKFCGECNRIRLTSNGWIKPCLHSESEINIKKYFGNYDMLLSTIKGAILNKPLQHHLNEDSYSKSKRNMYQIGG